MRVLDLFSGIGGFSLGLERAGMETVAFCEIEPFCQKVLAKHWPDVPIYSDIKTLTAERLIEDGILADTSSANARGGQKQQQSGEPENREPAQLLSDSRSRSRTPKAGDYHEGQELAGKTIDLICGGYPCQPFSNAGKRAGAEDDRHLWPEMYRLIETIRPRFVVAENVAGHITMGLDDVLSDLEAANYTWWTFVIPACAVDARHRRDRTWIIAHSGDDLHAGEPDRGRNQSSPAGSEGSSEREGQTPHRKRLRHESGAGGEAMANTQGSENNERGTGKLVEAEQEGRCQHAAVGACGKAVANPNTPRTEAWLSGPQQRKKRNAREPDNRCGEQPGWTRSNRRAVERGLGGMAYGVSSWLDEPDCGRLTTGQDDRVSRLKALGNAVVPQVVEVIGRAIMEADNGA